MANGSERKLRRGGPQSGKQKEKGGDDQPAFAANLGADPASDETANDTTNQRARSHKPKQRIGGVGAKIPGIDEIGPQAADCARYDGRVISEEQSAQGGDKSE